MAGTRHPRQVPEDHSPFAGIADALKASRGIKDDRSPKERATQSLIHALFVEKAEKERRPAITLLKQIPPEALLEIMAEAAGVDAAHAIVAFVASLPDPPQKGKGGRPSERARQRWRAGAVALGLEDSDIAEIEKDLDPDRRPSADAISKSRRASARGGRKKPG